MVSPALALALAIGPDPAIVRSLRESGHDDVARAYSAASDEYRTGISEAILVVDPLGEHPWWALELWRICWRESKCGRFGVVTIHEGDSWVGPTSYAWAVVREQLAPIRCEAHRLEDYGPVIEAWHRWEDDHGERPLIRGHLASLPHGTRSARDFATRGGFGMNAARAVRLIGDCVGPEAMDSPRLAALAAARELQRCQVDHRPCTCADHTERWVGRGRFGGRRLWRLRGKSKASAVASQCGPRYALGFVFSELLHMRW